MVNQNSFWAVWIDHEKFPAIYTELAEAKKVAIQMADCYKGKMVYIMKLETIGTIQVAAEPISTGMMKDEACDG